MTDGPLLRTFDQSMPNLDGANIPVTGGTGTFVKSFAEMVSQRFSPQRLIIFSRDEFKQSEMQAAYPIERFPFMRFSVGDVRDRGRLEMAMRSFSVLREKIMPTLARLKNAASTLYFKNIITLFILSRTTASCRT